MTAFSVARVIFVCICLLSFAQPADARSKWWLSWLDELSGPGPFKGQTFVAEIWCVAKLTDTGVAEQNVVLTNLSDSFKTGTLAIAPFLTVTGEAGTAFEAFVQKSPVAAANRLRALESQLEDARNQIELDKANRMCFAGRENALFSIVLETGQWNDEPDGRYEGDTDLKLFQGVAYFPLHRVLGGLADPSRVARAIELGTGIGAYRLSGTTIREPQWWRGSIPFRVRIIPSELFYGNSSYEFDAAARERARGKKALRAVLQAFQFRFGGDLLPGALTSIPFNGLDVNENTEWLWTTSVQIDLGALVWAPFRK